MTSVGQDFPVQQERVRDLIERYKSIGPAGKLAILYMRAALKKADEAAISGDPVAQLRSYQELRDFE